jgi:hypothetical protein
MGDKSGLKLTEISKQKIHESDIQKPNEELEVPETASLSGDTEISFEEVKLDFNYYDILRRVLLPFILTGAPISYYLKSEDATKFRWMSRSGIMIVTYYQVL